MSCCCEAPLPKMVEAYEQIWGSPDGARCGWCNWPKTDVPQAYEVVVPDSDPEEVFTDGFGNPIEWPYPPLCSLFAGVWTLATNNFIPSCGVYQYTHLLAEEQEWCGDMHIYGLRFQLWLFSKRVELRLIALMREGGFSNQITIKYYARTESGPEHGIGIDWNHDDCTQFTFVPESLYVATGPGEYEGPPRWYMLPDGALSGGYCVICAPMPWEMYATAVPLPNDLEDPFP